MPDGKTHSAATVFILLGSLVPIAYYKVPVEYSSAYLLGLVITFLINPDLDLNRRFPKSKPQFWLWWIYWWPYSRAIPHRGPLSHWIIVSTVIRFGYAFWTILYYMWYNMVTVEAWYFTAAVLAGMTVSDAMHIFLDWITGWKK